MLLIACANLANLLLARALSRRRELAVRTAIGRGRERLVRQLMTESLLLAAVGGALRDCRGGRCPCRCSRASCRRRCRSPQRRPSTSAVLIVAVALTALTGIAFGLAPVLRVGSSPDLEGLREGARAGGGQKERLRSALVVAEIVVSVVLLVSAGLLIRALLTVQGIDPGFTPKGVLTMRTDAADAGVRARGRRARRSTRVYCRTSARLPGVTAAGYVSFLPISSFRGGIWPVSVKGDVDAGDTTRSAEQRRQHPLRDARYFATIGMPVKRGRDIRESDSQGSPVRRRRQRIVRQALLAGRGSDRPSFHVRLRRSRVVGVVGDVRFRGLETNSEPQVYLSSQQVPDGAITFYTPKDLAVRVDRSRRGSWRRRCAPSSAARIRSCRSPTCGR